MQHTHCTVGYWLLTSVSKSESREDRMQHTHCTVGYWILTFVSESESREDRMQHTLCSRLLAIDFCQ